MAFDWYKGMVIPGTGRFQYLYLPPVDRFDYEECPIRDLGTVWDVEVLSRFLGRDDLWKPVETSLKHYQSYLVEKDGGLILDSRRLQERSSIAHSAFMILALLNDPQAKADRRTAALAQGIMGQQRRDGAFKVYFEELSDQGEEFYPGEAMLALAEYFRESSDERALSSVVRGLRFYDSDYFAAGKISSDMLVFFANWQSQAGRAFVESTRDTARAWAVADYMFRMHDQIIEGGFYEKVESDPDRQISVTVACALEGLNDAIAIARRMNDRRVAEYHDCICIGLDYLIRLQCTEAGTAKERGGFGISFDERAQRIDITGHAASALMKSIQNGIECA